MVSQHGSQQASWRAVPQKLQEAPQGSSWMRNILGLCQDYLQGCYRNETKEPARFHGGSEARSSVLYVTSGASVSLPLPARGFCDCHRNGSPLPPPPPLSGFPRLSWRGAFGRICPYGHGEVWTDWNSTSKFFQYGWRCTTNEDMYTNKTLLGNWNEERYDIQKRRQLKPLPSQYGHYFESTYGSDYSKEMPRRLRRVTREPHWFPGHQPELEPPPIKPTARSCYMIDYEPPHGRAVCSLAEGKPKAAAETPLKQ
ncbi:UPF0686 protein C11orf1 like [Crotalus adamanteus]|uniref:UPF0686 protein C11orf1 like n=1 Tax=Crotalus adamanteus TaxID=8729 RepID=A0AAW1AZ37_CROAD